MKALNAIQSLLGLSLTLSLTGCSIDTVSSTDVKTTTIHQRYSVEFSESEQKTVATAQFRVGGSTGTTLDLRNPAMVKAFNESMNQIWSWGTAYSTSESGFFPKVEFTYVNADGKMSQYVAETQSFKSEPLPSHFSRKNDLVISLQADNWDKEKDRISLTLLQKNPDQNQTPISIISDDYNPNTKVLTVKSAQLAKATLGVYTIQLSRSRHIGLSQKDSEGQGVSLSGTYRLPTFEALIHD